MIRQCFLAVFATIFALLGEPVIVLAVDFYVDPVDGSSAGDGTETNPWKTLQDVVEANLIETHHWESLPYHQGASFRVVNPGAPIKAGDTIYLKSGYHGEFDLTGAYNTSPITIAAAPGHQPVLKRASLRSVSNWVLRGLSISPAHGPVYEKPGSIVDIDNHGWSGPSYNVTIESCQIFSVDDISSWDRDDWLALAPNAISVEGDGSRIIGNQIRNIRFGISVTGKNVLVSQNRITNFAGDGIRGLGDYGIFEYNIVENGYKIDDNHDDGFQSWSLGPGGVGTGEVRGVVLRGNTFINNRDPAQPLRTTFQGIGCFDGFFVDWVVENNVVIVDHWHGITLMGARNSRIVNNTVIDLYPGRPGPSWVRISPHKNGQVGSGNVVRNNLVGSIAVSDPGTVSDHNIVVSDPEAFFVNPSGFDLSLKEGSPAIDKGSGELAPSIDIFQKPRPLGAAVDVGAHEFGEPDRVPPASPTNLRLTLSTGVWK